MYMKVSAPNTKGFTLIEMLIAVSLIALLSGILIPSFTRYSASQNLRQAREKLKSDLRTAQNNAMTGANSTTVDYWGIRFSPDSGTYALFRSTDTSDCGTVDVVRTTMGALPNGTVTLFSITGNQCIYFAESTGDASGQTAINVGYASSGDCIQVDVASNGLITSSDIQTCP